MPEPLRIMSYNVRYFGHALKGLASTERAERRIAAAVLGLDPLPDVICLQEVETGSLRSTLARRGARIDAETQLEGFMARLEEVWDARRGSFPYEAFYFRAHAYRVRTLPLYTTGLAVIVNTRHLKVGRHNVAQPHPITYHHVELWRDRKQTRICAHVVLEDPEGRPFHVFNTHLSLPTPFAREFWSQREKMGFGVNQLHEARTLAGFVERNAQDQPFIVCGDFNSRPDSPVFRYLTDAARFRPAQRVLNGRNPARPFPTAGFMHLRMQLDHLFSGTGVEWLDLDGSAPFGQVHSPFHGLSDHVPLIGRFRLREQVQRRTA